MGTVITLTYLHKGWISMSDKIYGFQTTSISEMDMCKEPYIYIYMCNHVYVYIYTYVFAMRFRYLFICINRRTYFITSTLIKYTYIFRKSTNRFFQTYATLPQFRGRQTSGLRGNVLCCPCVSSVYSQYTILYIYYILKLCHTLPYTIY